MAIKASGSNGSSKFERRVLEGFQNLQTSFNTKLTQFMEQLVWEQKSENDRLLKGLQLEKKFEFRRKGNKVQHNFNEKLKCRVEDTVEKFTSAEDVPKAVEALKEGLDIISER